MYLNISRCQSTYATFYTITYNHDFQVCNLNNAIICVKYSLKRTTLQNNTHAIYVAQTFPSLKIIPRAQFGVTHYKMFHQTTA